MLIKKEIDKSTMKFSDVEFEQCEVYEEPSVWIASYLGYVLAIENNKEECVNVAKIVFYNIKEGDLILWENEFEY